MADAIVGALVQNLQSLIQKQFGLIWGVEDDLRKLEGLLSTVRDVLYDAELKQINNKPIENWLMKLKTAAYVADDVLDEWFIEAQRSEFTQTCCINQVSSISALSCLNPKNILFRLKIAKKMKELISEFEDIARQRSQFILNQSPKRKTKVDKKRETASELTEPHVYGRDEDIDSVISTLLKHGVSQEDVTIYPIVGIGGLGKTTLAQKVYHNKRVARHFDIRIWVCVSEPFDVGRVLKAIIEDSDKKACDLKTLERKQKRVHEILQGKRYFLVLDDVWNENRDEWLKLKGFLKGGDGGSSILVTTRLETVASITGTIRKYSLGALSDEDCWCLFKNHAFGVESEEHPNLVTIGKEIVKRCKGIPLAAKSLGSLLWLKTEEQEWERVRDSELWDLKENSANGILPVLRLSYNNLPPRLRQCFAYCSLLPKANQISKYMLIHLWVANGFIQSEGTMGPEEVGADIFNKLLHLSFFQDTTEDDYGNVITFKLHNLMHDLASSVAKNECFIIKVGETKYVPKSIRHLLVISASSSPTPEPPQTLSWWDPRALGHLKSSPNPDPLLTSLPSLRSLITFGDSVNFHSFKFSTTLRVLDLSKMNIETVPPSIRHLKHLRYLDLSHTRITSLPKFILKLRNMRSLIMIKCHRLQQLPENMRNMHNLRHLDVAGCYSLTNMPVGVGNLTLLQTLRLFVVGAPNSVCGRITELQELDQLRGELEIKGLEHVRNLEDIKKANLRNKQHLTKLSLIWVDDDSLQESNRKEVLEGLQLPPKLLELVIQGYHRETYFPLEFLGDLNTLQCLKLSACSNLVSLPHALLQMITNSLKRLIIDKCGGMKCLPVMGIQDVDSSLVHLKINHCHNLTSVSEGLRYLTSLETLEITSCEKLVFEKDDFQHLISLQDLRLKELPELKSFSRQDTTPSLFKNVHKPISEGLRYLTSLRKLEITSCEKLVFAEDDFHHLISLQDLRFKGLPELRALPDGIQHLVTLQHLDIEDCENVRVLPQWLKCLTSLQSLNIANCHQDLHKRWKTNKGGEDWDMISHVTYIDIWDDDL